MEGLLAANPVEVPKSLVDAQVREMQTDAARRMGGRDASQLPPAEPFVEGARRRVALGLLIGELIRTREIKLDRARVDARLAELASGYPEPDDVIKAYRQNADALRQVENIVIEEQVVDLLLEQAAVKDQAASFKDVMNFGA
jgi:trigger factor